MKGNTAGGLLEFIILEWNNSDDKVSECMCGPWCLWLHMFVPKHQYEAAPNPKGVQTNQPAEVNQ